MGADSGELFLINKLSMQMKSSILRIFFIVSVALISIIGFAESREYYDQSIELVNEIDSILISEGVCSDRNDCVRKRLVFSKSQTDGVYIETFSITNKELVRKIIEACMSEYEKYGRHVGVELRMYLLPHSEMMGLKKLYVKPFVSLVVKGDEK